MSEAPEVHDESPERATLFHLAVRDEWLAAGAGDTYAPSAFASEGFIHCSYREQLSGVYARYYRGRTDLVVLEIGREHLVALAGAAALRDELSPTTGELFPHVYAALPRAAVHAARAIHDIGYMGA